MVRGPAGLARVVGYSGNKTTSDPELGLGRGAELGNTSDKRILKGWYSKDKIDTKGCLNQRRDSNFQMEIKFGAFGFNE